MRTKLLVFSLMGLLMSSALYSQTLDEKYTEDVKTIATIIDAYYAVISGASEDPWQFERDNYLHSDTAVITRLDDNGKVDSHTLEAEYIPLLLLPKEDFYEKELKRKVSQFGNMAQVWSAYEVRTKPEIASNIRGLNSIQLHFENGRWFIDSWTTQMETETNTLVTDFLKAE
ncbi:hypothetical protein [Aequorivita lipolytica]|uniref:Nuclear transport factor 2 family protein n=1 Tax=Aequorivita lipolytica TaxID=153267 RepID=A0A5C6YQW6_9FLAO|nr:hypothetical protein [Aequorivita lipolytica]TXD69843.1 hypothetical protein ESV24_05225 [Aequorivita lipolytica]SRX50344.1 hypothetical protein AEQU2_00816 [Aequorivita lipolytica]